MPARLLVGWVARCWALRDQAPALDGVWLLVFLWLFGCWIVDASIFYSCLLRSIPGPLFCGGLGWLSVCFVVLVCVATSYEGRMVDALASRADEGRRSLR